MKLDSSTIHDIARRESLTTLLVACSIAHRANQHGVCYATVEKIAGDLRLHPRTVAGHIRKLAALGHIDQWRGGYRRVGRRVVGHESDGGVELDETFFTQHVELGVAISVLVLLMAMADGEPRFRTKIRNIVEFSGASRRTIDKHLHALQSSGLVDVVRLNGSGVEIVILPGTPW